MIPLLLFLLGLLSVYLGTVTAAFSALMRLSLRLEAERSDRHALLGPFLDDPLRLFVPARLLLTVMQVTATALLVPLTGLDRAQGLPLLVVAMVGFVLVTEHGLPLLLIRREPERVLEALLPSFAAAIRPLDAVTGRLLHVGRHEPDEVAPGAGTGDRLPSESVTAGADATSDESQSDDADAREDRALLRTIVDFRDTLVREVMTPRPDIVAISATASLDEVRRVFRDQQYSRIPAFDGTLDNVVGFVFVKDLLPLADAGGTDPIRPHVRPAHFVPETKKVASLLKEFQRQRVQSAIVLDEYGGTAGLVTLEDLLEELVGEIRDEYDTEAEAVVDEGGGVVVFSGKADVDELAARFEVPVARDGFDSVGGYLLAHLGRVPVRGERFEVDGLEVEVLEAERQRVTRVRIRRHERVGPPAASGTS